MPGGYNIDLDFIGGFLTLLVVIPAKRNKIPRRSFK